MLESREHIKTRMLKHAARMWGYTETQVESNFDPLVGLLLEACATELEKVSSDIQASRSRIMERLVSLLSPETLTGALPAHAVANAIPLENIALADPDMQFYTRIKLSSRGENQDSQGKDIYFSPTAHYQLNKATVRLMVIGNQLYKTAGNHKEVMATAAQVQSSDTVWLGIDQPEVSLHRTAFYFDFRNEADKKLFYHQLPNAKWYFNDLPLAHSPGMEHAEKAGEKRGLIESDPAEGVLLKQVMAETNRFYQPYFITLLDSEGETVCKENFPSEDVLENFRGKEVDEWKSEPIRWVKIRFPEIVSGTLLKDLVCTMNCFPVINRQLHEINFRMQDIMNVVPLYSEDLFFDLEKVHTDDNQPLSSLSDGISDASSPVLLMRQGGIGRFDERDAADIIDYLLQLLRDERAAFAIMDNDFVNKEMKNLKQVMNKLEQRLEASSVQKGSKPYLVIQREQHQTKPNLTIQFSSTYGRLANHIKPGTRLLPYNGSSFISNNVMLVSQTIGGRDKLSATEKVMAYKSALLSKDRLTTAADIKAYCESKMGHRVGDIEIHKGISILPNTRQGYQKTIDVVITLSEEIYGSMDQSGELDYWRAYLTQELEEKMMIWMPIKVILKR
ncbi:type VI secretion system baseplate subunit TssF [Cyclobacterium roseum]|uniref:type VI secretion system baseplate subunit TssF n=1 Tax=Cyclobacterium roseum TaxID=2666137 RepID=UPI001391D270|nr:type VI secretion system baseplate subunit TssF [Cyclobacterium roseum]